MEGVVCGMVNVMVQHCQYIEHCIIVHYSPLLHFVPSLSLSLNRKEDSCGVGRVTMGQCSGGEEDASIEAVL